MSKTIVNLGTHRDGYRNVDGDAYTRRSSASRIHNRDLGIDAVNVDLRAAPDRVQNRRLEVLSLGDCPAGTFSSSIDVHQ